MKKVNKTTELPEVMQVIPGFSVMEWLRGVRDEHYRLSIADPEAYRKMRERGRERVKEMARREGKEVVKRASSY